MNASQGLARFGALSRLMSVGVALLDTSVDLEFANSIAGDLLGAASERDAKTRWTALRRHAGLDARRIAACPDPMRLVVDFPGTVGTRSLRLEIHTLTHVECDGYLVLMRDRRAVDVLEANLLLASQMRSAIYVNRALAHDLRAPLNSMQLTLDLLADSVEAGGAEDPRRAEHRERHMAILREELARLSEIVRSSLDRADSSDPVPQSFDLREIVREGTRLLGSQARRQRVELELKMPDRPVILSGYRDRIRQALINLILDGLEPMPDGGRLSIELVAEGDEASTTVRGSGAGARSLDDVYRIHASGGSTVGAFGLYVARVIAESHGGAITAEGDPGRGLYFRLTLPLYDQQGNGRTVAGRARHS